MVMPEATVDIVVTCEMGWPSLTGHHLLVSIIQGGGDGRVVPWAGVVRLDHWTDNFCHAGSAWVRNNRHIRPRGQVTDSHLINLNYKHVAATSVIFHFISQSLLTNLIAKTALNPTMDINDK